MKTLAKIQQDKWLGGVCSGFAYALSTPTWVIRLAATALFLMTGIGLVFYLLLWIFMPSWHVDPSDYRERTKVPGAEGGPPK